MKMIKKFAWKIEGTGKGFLYCGKYLIGSISGLNSKNPKAYKFYGHIQLTYSGEKFDTFDEAKAWVEETCKVQFESFLEDT